MKVTYQTFSDRDDYQSLLVVNEQDMWKETLYFTFYRPWGGEDERLYAGRYMADVHFKNKPCECVLAFDFHRWDAGTLDAALQQELPPRSFEEPLRDVFERALNMRESNPGGFSFTTRPARKK